MASSRSPQVSSSESNNRSDVLASTPPPLPPLPRNASTRFVPLSPTQSQQSPTSSPNVGRTKREAFPRSQLWTWKHNGEAISERSATTDSAKDDLIENMLRECALTAPGVSSSAASTPGTPSRRIHRHHHVIQNHQHQQSVLVHRPTSCLSPRAPTPPLTTQQQPQLQTPPSAFVGSRRRIHKNEPSIRDGIATSPSSSASSLRNLMGAAAGDGWRTYKFAHRTNKLIAKTRQAIEVLTHERDAAAVGSNKVKHKKKKAPLGEDASAAEDDNDDDDDDSDNSAEPDAVLTVDVTARDLLMEQSSVMAQFARDVLTDDDDGSDNNAAAAPNSKDDRDVASTSLPVLDSAEFWRIYKRSTTSKRPDSARSRFIAHCERDALLVLPVLALDKSSRYDRTRSALRFDNYYFGDARAAALGDALAVLPVSVQHLTMTNVGLSGSGTAALLNGIKLRDLRGLDVSANRIGVGVGSNATRMVLQRLADPHVHLTTLALGNNQLGDAAVNRLVQSLLERCTLTHLDLQQNAIYDAAAAIGELLRVAPSLTSLNLSWNHIRGTPAQHFATCMRDNCTLTHLDLSSNSLGTTGRADVELGACLALNTALRHLDVSHNHIRAKSVLVFVDALRSNRTLETLHIRGNPIGHLGAEAIVRAVASSAIATCAVDMGACNLEIDEDSSSSSSPHALVFSGGTFTLQTAEHADAILLRELLLLCWQRKTDVVDTRYNGAPLTLNRKDERAFFASVPATGTVVLTTQPNFERRDELIASSGVTQIVELLTRSFGHRPNEVDDDAAAKLFCIGLLADEYAFSVEHVNALLAAFPAHTAQVEKATAAAMLIPQIRASGDSVAASADDDEVVDCAAMAPPATFFEDKDKDGQIDVCGDICMVLGLEGLSALEQSYVEQRVGKWIAFNARNPTGAYALNMANALDRRILVRLFEDNRYEQRMRTSAKLLDVSQHGERAQALAGSFRNVRLNHRPVVMDSTWTVPRNGVLAFDFASTQRPSSACTALSDTAFEQFVTEFTHLGVPAELKLVGLRAVSTRYYFTSSQTQRVMEHFGACERVGPTGTLARAEVFIILYRRTVDAWHHFESLALLDVATKLLVLDRVGYLNCFHPLQAHATYERLLLDAFDQRQLVLVLVKLGASGEVELSDVVLNGVAPVAIETWRQWTSDDKLPIHGSVSVTMRATPAVESETQLPMTSVRRKLLQTLLLTGERKAQEGAAVQ